MFFKPHGVAATEVIDPDDLAQEFDEASRVGTETSQYQWLKSTFSSVNRLKKAGHVVMDTNKQYVELKDASGTRPIITTLFGTPSTQLFQIPYNTGLHEIGTTGGTPSSVGIAWTSAEPELVMAVFDFQYIRENKTDMPKPGAFGEILDYRAQVRIAIDDAPIPGTGPFAVPLDGNPKGVGFGGRSIRSCAVAMLPLAAGRHYVTGMAGQGAAIPLEDKRVIKRTRHLNDPPFEGLCIGSRRMTLLRFKKGGSGMRG